MKEMENITIKYTLGGNVVIASLIGNKLTITAKIKGRDSKAHSATISSYEQRAFSGGTFEILEHMRSSVILREDGIDVTAIINQLNKNKK